MRFSDEMLTANARMLLVFTAHGCACCEAERHHVRALEREISVVEVSVEDDFELAERFAITTLPTMLLFERATVVARFSSTPTLDEITNASRR